jgi:hypothetical protein
MANLRRVAILTWAASVVLWTIAVVWRYWLERATYKRVVPDQAFVRGA